jgi:hypothetical protein
VNWWLLGDFLLCTYPVARVTGYGIERAVQQTVPLTRWLLLGTAATLLLAFVTSAVWSRCYWGYFFTRPSTAEAVRGLAAVHGISVVECDLSTVRPQCSLSSERSVTEAITSCRKDPYYCLKGRIAVGSADAGLLPPNPSPITNDTLRQVEAAFADRSLLVPSDDGYDGNRGLGGIVATGQSLDGEPVIAVGFSGGQVSNDHHPYYELRLSVAEHAVHVLRRSVFFFDVAGVEGLEWRQAFIGGSILGLTAWVPIGLATGIAVGHRRRRIAGDLAREVDQ